MPGGAGGVGAATLERNLDGDAGAALVRLAGTMSVGPGLPGPGVSVLLIERGSGVVEVNGTARPVTPGMLAVIDGAIGLKANGLRGWLLRLERRCPRDLVPGVYAPGGSSRARGEGFMHALAEELRLGAASDGSAVDALVKLILLWCARAVGSMPAAAVATSASAERVATDVLQVIDRRFSERLSLADVAEDLSRSPSSVARAVREATGQSVLELIAERRLDQAHTLLLESDLPVGEIAARVGYPSLGYFHRVFRRATGTTPQRWRQSRRALVASPAEEVKIGHSSAPIVPSAPVLRRLA